MLNAQVDQIARLFGIGLLMVVLVTAWFKLFRRSSVMQPGAPRIVTARTAQTTTVLSDGRVLVVGGRGARRSAEVYDPAGGFWSATASLMTGRYEHTATLLPDGRVLVAGGSDCRSNCTTRNALRSVEIYDPSSDTWTLGAPMRSSRWGHIAAALPDGRILVAGGIGGDPGNEPPERGFPMLASSEVYDPNRKIWMPAAPMHLARAHHRTIPLTNGCVLIAGGGGYLDPRQPRRTAELSDPNRDTWVVTSVASVRELEWIGALPDGTVLAMGDFLRERAIYDPATDQWHSLRTESPPLGSAEPVMLPNGLVLVSGGTSHEALTAVADAALFDPSTETWTPTGHMGIARGFGGQCGPTTTVFCESHTPVVLHDQTVLVYGGRQAKNRDKFSNTPYVITSEVYDLESGTWSPLGRRRPSSAPP
jgi:hypothetical protein